MDRFYFEGVFGKAAQMVSTMPNFKASNFFKIGGKDVAQLSMAGDHLVAIFAKASISWIVFFCRKPPVATL